MRKLLPILAICVSLTGFFLIVWKFSFLKEWHGVFTEISPQFIASEPQHEVSLPVPVPILMYHHIGNRPSDSSSDLFVSPQTFESHLAWLAEHGFHTVSLDAFQHPATLSGKPIILTFDDGYQDAYTQAFPLLKRYGFQGTFYIVTNDIGKDGFVTKDELLTMKNDGMTLGSHSLSHPDLTKVSALQARREIYESKKALEQILNTDIQDFCYPSGIFDQNIEEIVENSDYKTAVSTVNDTNATKTNIFRLNRFAIREDTNLESFLSIEEGY